jgi:hypothetical protein
VAGRTFLFDSIALAAAQTARKAISITGSFAQRAGIYVRGTHFLPIAEGSRAFREAKKLDTRAISLTLI